jgi:hypothetical protein
VSGAREEPLLEALLVDVRAHLAESVASLYSHLVTRPTGRAVRLGIERQLGELHSPSLSLVDLSAVTVLDYSCADEVVAKLVLRYTEVGGVFIVLRGVREHHRDPIEAVLDRHSLAVVAETQPGRFELLGVGTEEERSVWTMVEERRRVATEEMSFASHPAIRAGFERLVARRLLFQAPSGGAVFALSTLIR